MFGSRFKRVSLALTIFSLLTWNSALANPQIAANWKGMIQLPGQQLKIKVHLQQSNKQWSGTIDIPAQKAKDLPLYDIKVEQNKVEFKIKGVPGNPTFKGTFSANENSLNGTFIQAGQNFKFELSKPSQASQEQETLKLANKLKDIESFIEEQRQEWDVPGVAVGVIKGDKVILSKGFGQRNIAQNLPVTEHTLFAIGSTTKAFTSVLIGNLVDEGLIDWKTPVKHYLPEFKLKDSYATEKMNVIDLLSHQSGLPRHDLMWYGSSFSRQELFQRLQYLPPSASFREKFQYQNLMFMTAGILAEKMTDQSWENLVQKRIFEPLKMNESSFSIADMSRSPDHAQPYKKLGSSLQVIPFRDIQAIGPAGSINASIEDLTKWVRFNLNGNPAILSAGSLKAIHSPHVVVNSNSTHSEIPFVLYGMGWMIAPYQGQILIEHGGNIDGFSANISIMPQTELGVVVLTNRDVTPLPNILTYGIYDRLNDKPLVDWSARIKKGFKQREQAQKQGDVGKVGWTKPSHNLKDYVGKYQSPGYGLLEVQEIFGQLKLNYNGFTVPLKHWHYDVFSIDDKNLPIHGLKLQFFNNIQGEIEKVSAVLEMSTSPVDFWRKSDPRLSQTDYLKKLEGSYELFGIEIKVSLKGNKLYTSIPGQPTDQLVPHRDMTFRSKSEPQIKVTFIEEGGRITKAQISQPNGTFNATKKL